MRIVVPKEVAEGERRVALTPDAVSRLVRQGLEVRVQRGAGAASFFADESYEGAGATLAEDAAALLDGADVAVKVQGPTQDEVGRLPQGAALIAFLYPSLNLETVKALAERRITAFSMDAMPRIARAQSMDALSSMSSLAGYKAVLTAASRLGKNLPMMTTAAGTVPPARALVLGVGVAGLQAIATARRLGAVVEAYDVRPTTRQDVESLGAKFIAVEAIEEAEGPGGYAKELPEATQRRQGELLRGYVQNADMVITTALVPGKRAPVLVPEEMVRGMRPGSVIVDVAAETGGNCELTVPGEEVVRYDVTICGPLNIPSSMPVHASQLYARNVSNLLQHLVKKGQLVVDFSDAITQGCCITHEGEIVHDATKMLVG